MAQLILHIGTHKTATTYLQNHYFKSLENVIFIKDFNERVLPESKVTKNILYSYEGFSGVAWNNDWLRGISNDFSWLSSFDRQVEVVKKKFGDPVILVVFRKHGDITISMYKQYVQEGGVLTFDEFFGENGVIKIKDLNYNYRINKLYKNFSSVLILSYEDFKTFGDDYFDQVLAKFNICRNSYKKIGKDYNKRMNRSLSGFKLEFLRHINMMYMSVPSRIKKSLNNLGLRPRSVLQHHLSFWDSKDSHYLRLKAKYINELLQKDWNYVESKKINI